MAKLFWLQPDNTIVEFPLKAEQSLIGRSSRCDVCIKHPGISAEHAVIRQVSGAATVEDLGSTNGTRVNGKKLTHMHTLRHGDQIGVGRERLMYFAELDSAANFLHPESIKPFAIPAPVRERVNTESDPGLTAAVMASLAPPTAAPVAPVPLAGPAPSPAALDAQGNEPLLDISLLAALPKGTALAGGGASIVSATTQHTRTGRPLPPRVDAPAITAPVTAPPPLPAAPTPAPAPQTLVGSVAVLSGPAAGKRYPLTQTSVSLGKEGKQVVEFVRAAPTRWQIRQREGVTPAYINGDALAGLHDLAAGDVIEMTGVRLRFEISLTPK
jgi:predicted component of type VI protein secretion system